MSNEDFQKMQLPDVVSGGVMTSETKKVIDNPSSLIVDLKRAEIVFGISYGSLKKYISEGHCPSCIVEDGPPLKLNTNILFEWFLTTKKYKPNECQIQIDEGGISRRMREATKVQIDTGSSAEAERYLDRSRGDGVANNMPDLEPSTVDRKNNLIDEQVSKIANNFSGISTALATIEKQAVEITDLVSNPKGINKEDLELVVKSMTVKCGEVIKAGEIQMSAINENLVDIKKQATDSEGQMKIIKDHVLGGSRKRNRLLAFCIGLIVVSVGAGSYFFVTEKLKSTKSEMRSLQLVEDVKALNVANQELSTRSSQMNQALQDVSTEYRNHVQASVEERGELSSIITALKVNEAKAEGAIIGMKGDAKLLDIEKRAVEDELLATKDLLDAASLKIDNYEKDNKK